MEDGGVVEFEAVGQSKGIKIRRSLAEHEERAVVAADAADVARAAPTQGEPG